MIFLDKKGFVSKIEEVKQDIQDKQLRSKAWPWIVGGAIAGFLASCVKLNRPSVEPIIGRYRKNKEKVNA